MQTLIMIAGAAVFFSAAVFGLIQFYNARKKGAPVTGNLAALESEIASLGRRIEDALSYCDKMISLDEIMQKEQQITKLKADLQEEQEKLEKLDKQVENMQKAVEGEEAAHNSLKKGREEATTLAEELRSSQDQLRNEQKRLQTELEHSISELNVLNNEVELTAEQQAAFDQVYTTLQNAQDQVQMLSDVYAQAYSRFNNLESQYAELEREFTKLVEKELGPS